MAVKRETIVEIKYDTKGAEKSLKDLEAQQDKTADSSEDLQEATEGVNGALDSMLGELGISVQSFSKVQKGIKGTVTGFKSLKVAIAATGIGALIVAFTALVGWMNRTKTGQEALAKITGALGGAMGVLTDIVDSVGESIFNAFTNPQEAVNNLWETIKTNLINRVKAIPELFGAIGRTIKSALDLDFDAVKTNIEDVKTSLVQFGTGLDEGQQQAVVDGLAGAYEKVAENIERGSKASEREIRLRERKIAFITREAQLETQISNARLESENLELSAEERLAKNLEAQEKIRTLAEERAGILAEEIAILEERQALSNNTLEDDEELARLQAQLVRLNKQRDDQLKSVVTRQKALTNELNKQNDAKEKGAEIDDKEQAKIEERDIKAQERLAKLKEQEEIRKATEIEDAELQAQRLIEIENQRFMDLKASDELTKAELEEAEFVHQQNLNKIKSDASKKSDALNKKSAETQEKLTMETLELGLNAISTLAGENKAVASAVALINTFQGVTKALAEGGPILGPIQAGIISALGLKQVADIQATPIPKASRGMILDGPSHANGGVLIGTPGGFIEAEGDEAIVNKNTMRDPFLSKVVSWANQMGGGIPLAERGINIANASASSQLLNASAGIEQAIRMSPPVLVTERLESVQNEVQVSEQISTL